MTNTDTKGRQTRPVLINGRKIMVRKLVDAQMVHLMRHARILQKDDISTPVKLDSVDRMFTILKTVVVEQTDRDYLVEQEEAGEIELKDLMPFVTAFDNDEDEEQEKPKVRRGRPPAKRA